MCHFTRRGWFQCAILPDWADFNVSFYPTGLISMCHFIRLGWFQCVILPVGSDFSVPFYPPGLISVCHFTRLCWFHVRFYPTVLISMCHFTNLDWFQLVILPDWADFNVSFYLPGLISMCHFTRRVWFHVLFYPTGLISCVILPDWADFMCYFTRPDLQCKHVKVVFCEIFNMFIKSLEGHKRSLVSTFSYFCCGSVVSFYCTSDVLVHFGRLQKNLAVRACQYSHWKKIVFVRTEIRRITVVKMEFNVTPQITAYSPCWSI